MVQPPRFEAGEFEKGLGLFVQGPGNVAGPLAANPGFEPEKHAGEIDSPLSATRFLMSLYFEKEPENVVKALGGPEGVAAWRKRLRFLGQGRYRLIFEDPWFAMLFMGNPETALPLDAPLVPAALSRADVPEPVALRVFEIVLDKALSLRAEKDAESAWNRIKPSP